MAGFMLRGPLCVFTNSLPSDVGTSIRGATPPPGPVGTNPDAGVLKSAHSKPEDTFDTAIELFEKSPQATTPMGARILVALKKARSTTGMLTFDDLDGEEEGKSFPSEGWIKITKRHQDNPVKTSNWIVHEGYHVAVAKDGLLYVDEEIESRRIQGEYSVYLEETGIQLKNGKRYTMQKWNLSEIYRADRIVDWVIPQYDGKDDFEITADWIAKHKSEWGGFSNRNFFTRKYYAKILVDSQPTSEWNPRSIDPNIAKTLRELLDSSNRAERAAIEKHVGKSEVDTVLKAAGK